jgi:hypothetical protein
MDDQIMLTFQAQARGTTEIFPSSIYLADINESLGREAEVIEFKKIITLPFYATRSRLLSHRAGFVTVEFKKE